MHTSMENQVEIYQTEDDQTEVEVRFDGETVWLTQRQIVVLFHLSKANLSEHIQDIFQTGELDKDLTVRKFRTVQMESLREVNRERLHYNLDVIFIGYRVNTHQGIHFRKWATQRLKYYLIAGYAINKKRLAVRQQEKNQQKRRSQTTLIHSKYATRNFAPSLRLCG